MRVSEAYNLNRGQGELDFVDVDVRNDTALFVDPRALRLLTTPWGQECVSLIQHFFRTVLTAMREGRNEDAAGPLRGLRERNEAHLGPVRWRSRGTGLGRELGVDIREALAETDAALSGQRQDVE